jgi:hypothetical protein
MVMSDPEDLRFTAIDTGDIALFPMNLGFCYSFDAQQAV